MSHHVPWLLSVWIHAVLTSGLKGLLFLATRGA